MSASDEGYLCAPYLHDDSSQELKDTLQRSAYIDDMYFVTATFSEDGRAYFPSYTNTYLLARLNSKNVIPEIEKYRQEKPTFVFARNGELFQRDLDGKLNYVSVYYLDDQSENDIMQVAPIVAKSNRVRRAETASLCLSVKENPKFTFPYGNNLIVLEVTSDGTHQSDNKYCEKTRRDVARKGIRLTNLVNLSIIDKIK